MPFVVGKRVAPPDGTTVLFAVIGVMGRKVGVRVDGGRAAPVATGPADEPSVTLTMDQEAFWRLGFGRVEPARVVATGEVRIEGDVALGHRVLDSMALHDLTARRARPSPTRMSLPAVPAIPPVDPDPESRRPRCRYTRQFVCEPQPSPKRATRSVCPSRSTKRRSTRRSTR